MNAFTSKKNSRFDPSQRQDKTKTLVIANSNIRQPDSFSPVERKMAVRLGVKRLFDVAASVSALIVLAPFFLTIALFIKLDDGGPVFFRQIRWGLNGRKIMVFKFRSMRAEDCDPSGIQQTVKGDSRMTGIGALLRRTNIDELPQLFNVLMGDMSLVGPRCHAINMRAAGRLYEELVPHYHQRHIMRPGITSLAQTSGWRGPTARPKQAPARIACDIYYVKNFSLLLDFKILLKTLAIELRGGTGF